MALHAFLVYFITVLIIKKKKHLAPESTEMRHFDHKISKISFPLLTPPTHALPPRHLDFAPSTSTPRSAYRLYPKPSL